MNTQSIFTRQADPTYEDGTHFAHYVHLASEGQFRLLLGRRVTEILADAFIQPNHDLSFEHTIFAEVNGEVVGMASGYTAPQHTASSDEPLRQAAGRSAFRIACMFALATPVLRFLHSYDAGDFYVEFLAVDEAHRGHGIGSKLLQAMEDRARASGCTHVAIDVAARNRRAYRLYERCEFAAIRRWPRTRLVRPNILRMTKPL